MKKYLAILRIRFINSMQYRIAALAGIVTQFAWAGLGILSYAAFYKSNPSAYTMSFSGTVAYIWLQQAFLPLFMLWFFEEDIFEAIRDGNIAYELVRPIDLYSRWFCQSAASRLAKAALRCMPVLIVAFILPEPYRLILPPSVLQLSMFFLSMTLGFCVIVAFCMIVYISTFFLLSANGIKTVLIFFAEFLAGGTIPIPFFPEWLRRIVEVLPFASMKDIPLRIYSGNIDGTEAVHAILLQVFWLVFFVVFGRSWMQVALRRTVVHGG